jgi:NAD(P)-dependent dehydrogenase (short-subunit alcohol dehydrogenase family)
MNEIFSLEGKQLLITGASSGIGRAMAIECSKAGASVVLTARNEERLQETLAMMTPGGHVIYPADMMQEEDVVNLAKSIPEKLDGVVLCAGINDKLIIKQISNPDIDKMVSTNFTGPVRLVQSLLKGKKINKYCSFVFMSSVSAFYPSVSNALYASTKAAITQFSKILALEVLPLKARVNCIEPAFVETEMISKYPPEVLDEIRANYPLGRFAKPEEIAYAAIYYLSDASQLVTGTSLVIDGGYTLR